MPLFGCLHWQALLRRCAVKEKTHAPLVYALDACEVEPSRLGRQFYVLPRTRMQHCLPLCLPKAAEPPWTLLYSSTCLSELLRGLVVLHRTPAAKRPWLLRETSCPL